MTFFRISGSQTVDWYWHWLQPRRTYSRTETLPKLSFAPHLGQSPSTLVTSIACDLRRVCRRDSSGGQIGFRLVRSWCLPHGDSIRKFLNSEVMLGKLI